jgi:predicted RNA binding protein YcfA (HicA-like mRNA interferase family)
MTDRLPSLRPKEVVRALGRAGFVISRTSGRHCRLIHSTDPARKVTMPMHTDDLKRGTLRGILRKPGSRCQSSSSYCSALVRGNLDEPKFASQRPRRHMSSPGEKGEDNPLNSHRTRAARAPLRSARDRLLPAASRKWSDAGVPWLHDGCGRAPRGDRIRMETARPPPLASSRQTISFRPDLSAFASSRAAIAISRVTLGKSSRNSSSEWSPSM